MDEGYRYYHKQIVDAVKRIDPEMLVEVEVDEASEYDLWGRVVSV